ncbi:unnamed protein product [Lota lota]
MSPRPSARCGLRSVMRGSAAGDSFLLLAIMHGTALGPFSKCGKKQQGSPYHHSMKDGGANISAAHETRADTDRS